MKELPQTLIHLSKFHAELMRKNSPVIAAEYDQLHAILAAIAGYLNTVGIQTPRGGLWHATSVKHVLDRSQTI